jgi:hypothetical protein
MRMKLRCLALLVAVGSMLGVGSAVALARVPTTLTIDSSVEVEDGYWVDSGRMITRGLCDVRPVKLIGKRPDATTKLLDWDLTSLPGNAWATKSRRTGFEKVTAKVRRTKRCQGDSILVFPGPG